MKSILSSSLIALGTGFVLTLASANPKLMRTELSGKRPTFATHNTPVKIMGEKGKEIQTIPSIRLASGVVAIPARSLESFGLVVTYKGTERRVYVYSPPSHSAPGEGAIALGFKSDDHGIYSPISGYSRGLRPYPLASNQNGTLYVSVRAIGGLFPGRFRYEWKPNSRTVIIKIRDSMVKVW